MFVLSFICDLILAITNHYHTTAKEIKPQTKLHFGHINFHVPGVYTSQYISVGKARHFLRFRSILLRYMCISGTKEFFVVGLNVVTL